MATVGRPQFGPSPRAYDASALEAAVASLSPTTEPNPGASPRDEKDALEMKDIRLSSTADGKLSSSSEKLFAQYGLSGKNISQVSSRVNGGMTTITVQVSEPDGSSTLHVLEAPIAQLSLSAKDAPSSSSSSSSASSASPHLASSTTSPAPSPTSSRVALAPLGTRGPGAAAFRATGSRRRGNGSVASRLADQLPHLLDSGIRLAGPLLVLMAWGLFGLLFYAYFTHILPALRLDPLVWPGNIITGFGLFVFFNICFNHAMATFVKPGSPPDNLPVPPNIHEVIEHEQRVCDRF